MSLQFRYVIGHIWDFHAIVLKIPVKDLAVHQPADAYHLAATQLLGRWEDPKHPSTCLTHKWHVQVATHLKFKGENIVKISKYKIVTFKKKKK